MSGWAGDLMTFYGDWRRDSDSIASGYIYCVERLGQTGVVSSFGHNDLVEDADGYLLAAQMLAGKSIAAAVRAQYEQTGGGTRFRDYYAKRFGGKAATATDAAFDILTTPHNLIAAGRTYLVLTTAEEGVILPNLFPPDRLREYCRGWADVLVARAGLERRDQAKSLARHKSSFR
ncbi:hypothetical protein [Streptomyces sp. NPDC056948]|uniref:hypothetical protein n=1 Tax=Streptomyces sp. NPDC056948 TaxID=3345975 RepID=UPI003645F59E